MMHKGVKINVAVAPIPFIWLPFFLFLCCSLMMLICLLQFLLSALLLCSHVCRDPLMAHGVALSQPLTPGQCWWVFGCCCLWRNILLLAPPLCQNLSPQRWGRCGTLYRGLVSCLTGMGGNQSSCTRDLKWDSNFSEQSLPFHLEHKILAFLNTARW